MTDDHTPAEKSRLDRASVVVGITGTLITVVLTVWNAWAKTEIDRRQEELQVKTADLDAEIRRRGTTIEESKERVERYKWVYSLVPSLTETDPTKRNAALAMVRLALSTNEAQALLTGLQQSPDESVRRAATLGFNEIAAIEDADVLRRLIMQMNSASTEERKRATGRLEQEFAASPQAIDLVIARLQPGNLNSLTPSGLINSLYYLARTDPAAWTPQNARAADAALPALRQRATGTQTKNELGAVESVLAKVRR